MIDVLFALLAVLFFGLGELYTQACERL